MITPAHCRAMAEYNKWMNERLFKVCAEMSEGERIEERGAFFGSTHRTLNHILYGDLAFMSRFTGQPQQVPELGIDLHNDFDDLKHARNSLDRRILEWSATLNTDCLEEESTYTSTVDGVS